MRALAFALCVSLLVIGSSAQAQDFDGTPLPNRHVGIYVPSYITLGKVVLVPEYSYERMAPAWRTPVSGQGITIDHFRVTVMLQDQPQVTYHLSLFRQKDRYTLGRAYKDNHDYPQPFRGESKNVVTVGGVITF